MINKKLGYGLILVSLIFFIALFLIKLSFDDQAIYLCEATRANLDIEMKDCPAHKGNIPWLISILFGIGFLMLGSGIYLIIEPNNEKIKANTSNLDSEEKKIYDLLIPKGSMYQSDLIKESSYSKVKISRILDKLESKGLLNRKRRGMTNIVILK